MGNWTLVLVSMRKRTLAAAAALCIAASIGLLAVPAGPAANGAATPLCGSMAGATPNITKVMWIFMENRSRDRRQ